MEGVSVEVRVLVGEVVRVWEGFGVAVCVINVDVAVDVRFIFNVGVNGGLISATMVAVLEWLSGLICPEMFRLSTAQAMVIVRVRAIINQPRVRFGENPRNRKVPKAVRIAMPRWVILIISAFGQS